ncbi:MAG: tRNA pseudouridine(55) synthase TruB [Lachnospiraceae bacterium]|nr:tRNA pseudouridine(55) synthase TruB [Lachnospiraceae bacterium]
MNGIINVYKEKGFTSHDVVAKLRGILHQKKIGHTGTLDPDAVGVLPVCLGNATKLCDMLTDKDKTYEAVLKLGIVTDTQDMTGKVLEEKEVINTKEEIEEVIMSFVGDYEQIPPMYSALKVNGKKLYELAREGKTIERKARGVKIHEIKILKLELENQEACIQVKCSKGTYIRTLCHDIGQKLGCGGCMKSLIRTKVSDFTIDKSLTLDQIQAARDKDELGNYIINVDEMFTGNPKIIMKADSDRFVYNGNSFMKKNIEKQEQGIGEWIKVYDSKNIFVGIYTFMEEENIYKPVKMFL